MEKEDKSKVRTANVSGTGRTSFQFDISTWAAIDMIAEQAGLTWNEWAAKAIERKPLAKSKASAVRAALSDALMDMQHKVCVADGAAGPQPLGNEHPVVGAGYYRLDDATLAIELDGAQIALRDDSFEGFTFIIGYRDKAFGGNAFVCIENRLRDGLHLFMAKEEE
jgi:hypothetical protein